MTVQIGGLQSCEPRPSASHLDTWRNLFEDLAHGTPAFSQQGRVAVCRCAVNGLMRSHLDAFWVPGRLAIATNRSVVEALTLPAHELSGLTPCREHVSCPITCAHAQVPEVRERLLARSDWAELAAAQAAGPLGPHAGALSGARARSLLRSFEFLCDLEPARAAKPVSEVRLCSATHLHAHVCWLPVL